MNFSTFHPFLLLLFVVSGSSQEFSIPKIKIKNESDLYVPKGSDGKITCYFSGNVMSLLDYTVVWEFSKGGTGQRRVLSRNKELADGVDENKYGRSLKYLDVGIDVSIIIKNVSESDGGRYICKLLNEGDAELRRDDVSVIVPVPIKSMNFTFTMEETNITKNIKVRPSGDETTFSRAEKFEEGPYKLSCMTSGSNPAADVHIYQNEADITMKSGNSSGRTDKNTEVYSAFAESNIIIDKALIGQKISCQANVKTHDPVMSSFVISSVYSRQPRVHCPDVSLVKLSGEEEFKCFVNVDEGKLNCEDVYWINGESDKKYKHGDDNMDVKHECVARNNTYLETTLIIKGSYGRSYYVVYNGAGHSTVRKQAQSSRSIGGVAKYRASSLVLSMLAISATLLWL